MHIDKINGKKIKRRNLTEIIATLDDAKLIANIQKIIRDDVLKDQTGEPVFAADSQEFIETIINSKRGIIVMYYDSNQLVGFFELNCPDDPYELIKEYNLKKYLPNEDYVNMGVAESIVVLKQYRGNRLQVQMFERLEELARTNKITTIIGTVHPKNIYSCNNFDICGYKTISEIKVHGGSRYLKYKLINKKN